jgi:hypothetical protein
LFLGDALCVSEYDKFPEYEDEIKGNNEDIDEDEDSGNSGNSFEGQMGGVGESLGDDET